MKNGRIFAYLLLLAMLSSVGCAEKRPVVDPKAAAAWSENEKIFIKGLNGNQGDNDFDRSCTFFWRLTGLEIHVNYSTMGMFPTPETSKDLVRIRNWYKGNKQRLYWDESTGTVKVRGS
jgi:hypothetical protein